jgi:aspartyl-tRNA(Asn)/glutamyl-tRNA(Gln) amidotransferase subunit A
VTAIKSAAAELRAATTTCERLVSRAVESLEKWEPRLNAWISYSAEIALKDARRLDQELASGRDRGPLHGIPVGVKDNIATADFPTTCASTLPPSQGSRHDADSVQRLREAGAVVIGKTNLHEQAMGNPYVSEVGNPFDLRYNASGSSSGTAAATAAGTIFGGLGTDSGGSIRLPAAVCGVVGFKPTYGRTSLAGLVGGCYTMDHIGLIARFVDDAAILYEALVPGSRQPAASQPERLVVGLVTEISMGDPSPAVEGAVGSAAERLGAAGVEVRQVRLEGIELLPYAAIGYAWPEISAHHRSTLRSRRSDYGDAVRPLLDLGEIISGRQYLVAQRSRSHFIRQVELAMTGVDALLMPTTPITAGPRIEDADTETVVGGDSPDLFRFTRYTLPWNVTGYPAVTVPAGKDEHGLPIGAQIVARPHQDELVLELARLHEARLEWSWPQPPDREPSQVLS